jgi:hypothetical protein
MARHNRRSLSRQGISMAGIGTTTGLISVFCVTFASCKVGDDRSDSLFFIIKTSMWILALFPWKKASLAARMRWIGPK